MAKSKKKKKKRNGFLGFFLKLQIFLILLVVAGLLYYYGGGYAKKVSELRREAIDYVKNADTKTFMQDQTSIAYDVNGNTLSVLKGEHDRYYLTSAEIPQYAKDAAVSTEDKKFYRHHGVDYKAIMRAVYAMVRNGKVTQGASTITQQLARNVFLNQDKTWERKIEEIYISVELEKRFSKDQILEFYLNNIYFGNGYYGLEAAAHGYFNKNASELTVSEIAFLIGIPNRPSYFDPLVHMDHAMERRNLVLDNLLSDKKISRETYLAAFTEPVTLNRPEGVYNNYAETYLINCTTRILMQQNGFEFRTEFSDAGMPTAMARPFPDARRKTLSITSTAFSSRTNSSATGAPTSSLRKTSAIRPLHLPHTSSRLTQKLSPNSQSSSPSIPATASAALATSSPPSFIQSKKMTTWLKSYARKTTSPNTLFSTVTSRPRPAS